MSATNWATRGRSAWTAPRAARPASWHSGKRLEPDRPRSTTNRNLPGDSPSVRGARHQEHVLSLFAVGAGAYRVHFGSSDIRRERFHLVDTVSYRATLAPDPPGPFPVVFHRLFPNRGANVIRVFAAQRRLGSGDTAGKKE